jgi:surface protein
MSTPSGVSITYSIPQPVPLPNPYIPVATISGKNITINRSGSFQIVGKTTVTEIFTSSDVAYSTNVTVKKATPTILFASDIFPNDNFLITGKIYSFKPARIELPSSVPHEDIKVNYTSVPDDIVTILDVKDDYVSILINKSGSFQIKAETVETQNFISTSILSSKEVNVNIDAPLIYFPSTFMNELTYGFKNPDFPINTYAPEEAIFVYPNPNDVPSNLSISYSIPENQRDIATVTLSLVNKTSVLFGDYTTLAPVITIKNTGKFTLIAETSKTNVFKSVSIRREVEVIRATPMLSTPWDLFTGPLQAGETYNFSPPQFISPSPVPNEIPAFTYMSSNELIASIPNKISPIVKILKQGQFNIIAKTEASENYNEISIRSLSEYSTNINTPAILFPTDFKKTITYGDPYILKEAYFRYPTTAAANTAGLYITHSIEESRVASISISGTTNTVTINGAGTFTIRAETNTTDAFEKTSIYESVTIEQATPILTFASDIFPNNTVLFVSKTYEFIPATITFPPNVIPEDIEIIYTCVPSGVVTITGTAILVNKDASFQINAETVETKNFNKATASSIGERITNFDTPDIYFPQDFTKQVTFGQTYTLAPVIFTHPINPAAVGIFVTYTSTNTNVASISGTTVTIHKWGTFEIRAQTNQIGAFKSVSISKEVEVIRATPEVSTPWNALSLQSMSGLTTNTINDWTIIKVGDTLDYILNLTPTSLRVGTTITITYSSTDSVSGRILNIVSNTLTLSITNVSSAVYSRTNVLYQYFHNDLPYSTIYSTKTMLTSVPLRIPFNSFVWDVKLDYTNYYSSQGSTVNATITATSGPTPFPTATTTNVFNSTGYFTNSETRGFTTGKSILFRDPLGTLFSLTYTVVSGNTQNTYGTDPFGGARYSGIVRGYTVPYSTGTITTNNNVCFIGDTLTINPPQFIYPALPLRSEILPIQYTFASNNVPGIITITQDTPLVPAYVTVNKIGKFRIIANTIRSDRFENPEIISGIEYNTELLSPVITFPPDFTKQITFGQTYTLAPVIFTYPTNPVAAGISVTYTSTDPTVARISGTTVTILKSGTFKISAVTNQTDAFKSVSLTSDTITVNKATPTFPSSWNAFPTLNTSSPIYVGSVLTITAPLIASPLPVPTEILPITYESNPVDAITFAGTVVTLVKAGQFNLIARTKGSDNYNTVSVPASPITVVNIPPPTIVEQSGTIVWVGEPTITTSPRFVQANPRGTGTEWFAVVDNRSLSEITSYARTNNSSHFTPQGETKPVIFNNIVTTLMTNMSGMFSNALTFNQPISSWDTARVTDMSIMFSGAKAFNQLIGGWNTSSVINMRAMFVDTASFNQEISGWNTTNVVNMSFMFAVTMAFNRPIGSWNTANVSIMEGMFDRANAFNQPIGSWNTAKVDRMGIMFRGAVVFNQPIGSWNTNRVTDMSNMFDSARAFNQPIGSWNTASVTSMNSMFRGAVVFNQPINSWKTGAVNTMNGMFRAASSFNQNISFDTYYGYWNTSNVTDMSFMFSGATVFNGAIGWITSKVTNMREMFLNASSFNQYIGRQPISFSTPTELWNTGQVTDMSAMFYNAINFNSYIGNWNTPNLNSFANFRSSSPLSNANTPLRILQGGW